MRHAKIVCTLGPASATPEMVEALIVAGMDCARLNFSHGDHETHRKTTKMVREAAAKLRKSVAILSDLTGPKIRVGRFKNDKIILEQDAEFTLTVRKILGNDKEVSVNYPDFAKDLREGMDVLLDDGLLRLRTLRIEGDDVICRVEVGGELSNNKGINIPGTPLSTPSLTAKDREDLDFAVGELKTDYLALSFVRTADDVKQAQHLAHGTPVIAKIEKPEAIDNLAAIADAADAVMIARGDLGVEVGSERVPVIQKKIIREVNKRNKIVITATQMLDSMIRNPRPTRAEAADVANAVIDGSDALMLSAETASGRYPLESVRMMDAIIREVESEVISETPDRVKPETQISDLGFPNAAAGAAALLSSALPIKAIVTFTRDGRTGNLLSSYRPRVPIIAITTEPSVANTLAVNWGVVPYVDIPPTELSEALRMATSLLVREKFCKKGDAFVLVLGWPPSAATNTVKLHQI
ncbi:MAG: pyruvate kinase [Myxococcales bacterium]|nr:MAG: pyruvate kinase [Myxococcales bacterium]